MGGGHMETPARGQAQPGQDGRLATAAGTLNIAQGKVSAKTGALHHITPERGEAFATHAKGCEAWALDRFRVAGAEGCAQIKDSAPRSSSYAQELRKRVVQIETLHWLHSGDWGHALRLLTEIGIAMEGRK